MTDIEKLEHAKVYIDKLANGTNPLNDRPIPDTDLINNVHLSRCFFFVSDVLRQVIENGGAVSPVVKKEPKKLPLNIPFEKRAKFEYSNAPIPVSEITRRINELIDTGSMQKLRYTAILSWLTEIGILEWATSADQKRVKRPTTAGQELGISLDERTGSAGVYHVVVYSTAAQHFIVDNLDSIIDAAKQQAEMQGTPWTQELDTRLTALRKASVPASEIADILKRSASAVRSRMKRLGLD